MPVDQVDVVFVHGVLSNGQVWDTLIRLLSEDRELGAVVRPHVFEYDSPLVRPRPDERIAEIDDIADQLRTFLATDELARAGTVVLVTHSQGGLIAQRYLVRMLRDSQGRDLARIKRVAMYACPNSGSEFLLSLRRWVMRWRNPQERELRPFEERVAETQRALLRDVVNATGCTTNQCHIPISAYAGAKDRIVPPQVAKGNFPEAHTVAGNHFTIIRPASASVDSFKVLRQDLLKVASGEPAAIEAADDTGDWSSVKLTIDPPFGRREGQLYGRDHVIRAITTDRSSHVQVLAGMGGAGKSRIALEIAYRARREGHRVWWINLTRINGGMREVARQLDIPESLIEIAWQKGGSPMDLVWEFLRKQAEPWLLIFDNADEPAELAADGKVSDETGWLRSPSGRGTVIVTTRDASPETWGTWCTVHQVRPLESSDGANMLMELAGQEAGNREVARGLSEELGGLPLALYAAAHYVKSERGTGRVWTGEAGIRNFRDYRQALRDRFDSAPGAEGRNLTEALGLETVKRVFQMSLELLKSRGLPEAAPLLKSLACLGTDPVPYHALLTDAGFGGSAVLPNFTADRRRIVLEGLADLGLIELAELNDIEDPDLSHVLSLHPVVHGIFRGDTDVRGRRAEYYCLILQLLLKATQDHDPDYPGGWPVWHLLVPHTVELCRSALLGPTRLQDPTVIASALELARTTCRYLFQAGILGPAQGLVTDILHNLAPLGYDINDREILALRHEKGRIAIEQGQPVAAEAELRDVVTERGHILGERDADTLASRHKLAKAVLEQRRWAEAESQLESIVEDERHVRGYEHSDTIVVRHSLARAIDAQGRYDEAEKRLREIRAVQLRKWPPRTPETVFVQHSLAWCLLSQGRAAEALAEVQDALRVIGTPRHALVVHQLRIRHLRALIFLDMGERDQAIAEFTGLLRDRESNLGEDHPETLRTRKLLADVRSQLSPDHPQ